MDVLFRKESDLNSTCILIMSIFIFIRHSQSFFMDAQFIIFFCFDSSLQREAKLSLQLALAPFSSCSCYNFSAQNLFLHTISSVQNQMLYNNCQLVLAVHTQEAHFQLTSLQVESRLFTTPSVRNELLWKIWKKMVILQAPCLTQWNKIQRMCIFLFFFCFLCTKFSRKEEILFLLLFKMLFTYSYNVLMCFFLSDMIFLFCFCYVHYYYKNSNFKHL